MSRRILGSRAGSILVILPIPSEFVILQLYAALPVIGSTDPSDTATSSFD
jgi:hypothetical protein